MAVIAIAGQIGSGGQDIGQEVAKMLEGEFVDTFLLAEAANRTGISVEEWDARDMRVVGLADRVARARDRIAAVGAIAIRHHDESR